MKYLFTTIVLLFSILGLLFPSNIYASEYTVKQYIVVPSDKSNLVSSDTIQNTYIPTAEKHLKDVQAFYSQTMHGKTFNITEGVDVINLKEELGDKGNSDPSIIINTLNLTKNIPTASNVIPVVYVIGANPQAALTIAWNTTPAQQYFSTPNHLVFLGNNAITWMLKNIGSGDTTLAHELGHAFGIKGKFGWALDHTCSDAYPKSCQDEAPKPYPGKLEGLTDVMYNTVTDDQSLSKDVFHNTTYNPEINKLYESPFLNPQKDTAPDSIQYPNYDKPSIGTLDKYNATSGDKITISGYNFGSETGTVQLYNSNLANQTYPNITINNWTTNSITFTIGDNPYGQDTNWDVYVQTSATQIWSQASVSIIIAGNPSITTVPNPKNVANVNFFVTCGSNKSALAGIDISVVDDQNNTIVTATSNYNTTSVSFMAEDGKKYYLVSPILEGNIVAQTQKFQINTSGSTGLVAPFSFAYYSCPPQSFHAALKKSIESITVNGVNWDYVNDPTFPLHIIANKNESEEDMSGTYYIPILITYTDDTQKQVTLTFHYDPNASLKPTEMPGGGEPTGETSETPPPGNNKKQCTYNEPFSEKFHGCSSGTRECVGQKGEKGCEYTEGVTNPDDCRVIKCDDKDYTPEPNHKPTPTESKSNPSPTDAEEKPGACERTKFFGCANRCNDKGQAYEIWGCENGTRKQETLNKDTNSDCAKECKQSTCKAVYYYDDNVNSCIHKRPLEDDPTQCAFDHVDDNYCGR